MLELWLRVGDCSYAWPFWTAAADRDHGCTEGRTHSWSDRASTSRPIHPNERRGTAELMMTTRVLIATNLAMFKNVPTAIPTAAHPGTALARSAMCRS
jgi:hypothetical protein